ncbi:cytochrome b-c1 complex subunit Rieske, mitochondrial-like [Melitaea cinxia]|uniref:cytochrome b-c1 complex subunit Rieske, mitochondrial-like n=1 Tax=Melitaea cinxia TaxID=113334 RepID=UPI001E27453B|nr:cytochrome b-c1 complex subunit Rieske, mitochondrial-like [Melitaea cinxia]
MNFLNTCGLRRGRVFWKYSVDRDSQINLFYLLKLNSNKKEETSFSSPDIQKIEYQFRVLPLHTSLLFWNQIRFQKDYPKLHRDFKHPNFDEYRKEKFKDLKYTKWHSGDEKYGYTYLAGFIGFLGGMYSLKSELTHFLLSMSAPADVLALATIEVDIKNIAPGMCSSYKWRGKPLFIKHRTESEMKAEADTPMSVLKDPESPEQRTVKPEWLIVIGICTHLGCVPIPNSGDWAGGFYCPCHGSHYDNVGRARKGPAPLNLEVPPYKFLSDTVVLVG